MTTTKLITVSKERAVTFTLSQDAINNYAKLDKQLNNRLQSKLCCPEIVAVVLNIFSDCTNKACTKPVVLYENTTTCLKFKTTMRWVNVLPFHCTINTWRIWATSWFITWSFTKLLGKFILENLNLLLLGECKTI